MPGKFLYTADALSRSPVSLPGKRSVEFQEGLEFYVQAITMYLPASKDTLERYKEAQAGDGVCSAILEH